MAYVPDSHNYLKKDWSGIVTANDLAIQNQPFSLGQHVGATPEQLAQQEREQWFRDRGLDPNKYYGEEIEAQAPKPGFNPAGGNVNTGKPLKQQQVWSDGRTTGYDASVENKLPKQPPIDPKAALARAQAWREQQRAIGAPGTTAPAVTAANWWQDNNYHPTITAAQSAPGMPPVGQLIDNGVINTPEPQTQQILPGLQKVAPPTTSGVPGMPLLPNYSQPMAQIGQPTRSVLPQLQPQQGLATPGSAPIGTPAQSFGNAAKLLQLPSYLRRGMGGIRRY